MFQRAKSFVRNHWKKAVIGGIAIQVAAYGVRYASDRFLTHQEDQAIQYWQKVKKTQYFENVDQNCIGTFRQLYEVMKMKIGEVLNAEDIQEKLKTNQVENKLEAWNELKIIAFTRVLVTIYGSSILYVFLRIQLSMVGGYLIKGSKAENDLLLGGGDGIRPPPSTTRSASGPNSARGLDEEAQRKYLQLSEYFVSTGIVKICQYVEQKVKSVVNSVSLKQSVSASDLEQIFWTIIRKKETVQGSDGDHVQAAQTKSDDKSNPTKHPWKYVFPEELVNNPEFFNGNVETDPIETSTLYRKLVCETFDLLESEDTLDILRYFESQGVSYCIDRISESMCENNSIETSTAHQDLSVLVEPPRLAVAKLIPTITSLHLIDVLDDPWVNLLANADNVRVMSANIYEAFCV